MRLYKIVPLFLLFSLLCCTSELYSSGFEIKKDSLNNSEGDTLSGFDKFNAKAEHLFTILPFPIITYSTDAGNVFGLAKFNMIHLYKNDTVTFPHMSWQYATMSMRHILLN